jgi:hypothetical protein
VTRPEIAAVIALSLGALAIPYHAWPSEPCHLALSLGLDSSGSVDAQEWRLQAEGVAAALRNDWLAEKMLAARMKLHIFEWSERQWEILPMTRIETRADLEQAATTILRYERRGRNGTGTGSAIMYGADAIEAAGCWEGVLDISGDEGTSMAPGPRAARQTVDPDLTINGLVVGAPPEVVTWYEQHVIQGAFAFVEYAATFEDFAEAMRRKMAREISQR